MTSESPEAVQVVEDILKAKSSQEVLNLWTSASAKLSIRELVWAHGKVSRKLLEAVSQ